MATAAPSSRGRQGMAPSPFRHVLVGWDGSADAVAALRAAVAIVGNAPGRVTALAVLPESRHTEDGPPSEDQARESFGQARAAVAAGSLARISLHTARSRHVARSICDYATEHGFDLLVLGRHGDGGLLHPRLGHVAEAAARAATVPVLLVSAS